MSEIILGGSEKARFDTLFARLEPFKLNERILILCPEQATVEMEQLFIEGLKLKGLLNIEVIGFKRLLHRIEQKTPGASRVLMDQTGRTMLLRRALGLCLDDLQLFKPMVGYGGFLEECCTTIEYFKQNGLNPETLATLGEATALPTLLKLKLNEFISIFKTYNAALGTDFYDEGAYYENMTARLETSNLYSDVVLCIVGFTSFTKLELNLLKTLAERAKTCYVELDGLASGETGPDAYRYVARTLDQLENFDDTKWTITTIPKVIDTEMAYFAIHFDQYPTLKYQAPPKAIQLRAALNADEEVEGVAVDLLHTIRSEDLRYRDIALLVEDVESYRPTVERLFREYDIPYFLDHKRRVLHHPLLHLTGSLLRMSLYGFQQEDVLEHLKTGYFDLSDETLGRFEAAVIENGLSGYEFAYLEHDPLMAAPWVAEVWHKALKPIIAWVDRYRALEGVSERIQLISEYFNDLGITGQIETVIEAYKAQGEQRLAYEEAQIFNALLNVMDQMKGLLVEVAIDEADTLNLFEAGVKQIELGSIPTQRDVVLIGNLERTRLMDCKRLYILGVNEGIIPPTLHGGDLFMDAEKARLKDSGLDLSGMLDERSDKAAYGLLKAITTPTESLMLSFVFSDAEGSALRKSFVIQRTLELFPGLEIKRFDPKEMNWKRRLKLRPALRQFLPKLRNRWENQQLSEDDLGFLKALRMDDDYSLFIENQLQTLMTTQTSVKLTGDEARALYPQPLITSPTRLERFVSCPFRHFADYGLRPKIIRENALEQLEVGNYHHTLLDQFSKHLIENGKRWSEIEDAEMADWITANADNLLNNKLRRIQGKDLKAAHTLIRLNQVGLRALKVAKRQFEKGQFKIEASELSISHRLVYEGLPAIRLELEDGLTVYLEGVIDRVDIADVDGRYYARVIDYKSGNKTFDLGDVDNGLSLQLPLYMGALVEHAESYFKKPLEPAGLFYSRVDDPLITVAPGNTPDLSEMEGRIVEALKLSGMSIDQFNVLEAMDLELMETGQSQYLPVAFKKSANLETAEFTKASAVYSPEAFNTVLEISKKRARQISSNIYAGELSPEPLMTDQGLTCAYCPYGALCGYDPKDPASKTRRFKRCEKEVLLQRLSEEVK